MSRLNRVLSLGLVIFFSNLMMPSALSADIPLLTWERGRIQQVIVGGGAVENQWQMSLEGPGISPMAFSRSNQASEGYAIFTIQLPDDLPTGGYTVVSEGNRSPRTVVAGINVIESLGYQITTVPFDLTKVVTIFVFFTALITVLRAKRFANYSFISNQDLDITNPIFHSTNRFESMKDAAYRWRLMTLINLPNSLFRYQLIREGELINRFSKNLYSYLPLLAFFAGIIASNESEKAGGIGAVGVGIFVAVGIIGAIDAFSGISATLGFWLSQILFGNIGSISDLLIIISVSISWITPAIFANPLREVVDRQVSHLTGRKGSKVSRALGIITAALLGGLLFYFGQLLLNSVLINFTKSRNISILAISIICLALLVKGILDELIVLNQSAKISSIGRNPLEISIARVTSPQFAFGVIILVFSFSYIWTKSAQQSIISAILFSAPYFLIFLRANKMKLNSFATSRRYILIEPFAVAGLTYLIYSQISAVPLFADRRAELFLILSALPGVIHGVYGLLYDSAEVEDREIIGI